MNVNITNAGLSVNQNNLNLNDDAVLAHIVDISNNPITTANNPGRKTIT